MLPPNYNHVVMFRFFFSFFLFFFFSTLIILFEKGMTFSHFAQNVYCVSYVSLFVFQRYWDMYERDELPTCAQEFQQNAPPYALDIGGEVFGFPDSTPLKPSKARTVAHAALRNAASNYVTTSSSSSSSSSNNPNKLASSTKKASLAAALLQRGGNDPLNASLQQHFRHGYYAATSFVDAQVNS